MSKYIITGGFFDDTSEGYIGEISLNEKKMTIQFTSKLITDFPDSELRVRNKGFTGGCIKDDSLWVCGPNQVLEFSLPDYSIKSVINNELFNDLHYVLATEAYLYVVNTGLESIDIFDFGGKLKRRIMLSSDERTHFQLKKASEFRTVNSHPHFFHANHCFITLDNDLLVTLARQRRVISTSDWSWKSPEFETSPHDGFIADHPHIGEKCLWTTNVSGKVIASDLASNKVLESWDLPSFGIPPGWTRGLFVNKTGFLVATTQIRSSTAGYLSGWTEDIIKKSKTTVAYVPFDKTISPIWCSVHAERCSKIFSIIEIKKK